MFTVTSNAAQQILNAAQEGNMQNLALRIAASRKEDGSIHYRIGFDEERPGDILINSEGATILIGNEDKYLLQGTVMDFGEVEPGRPAFIFSNPNDPHYTPPTE